MCSNTISIAGILGEGDLTAAVIQKKILALCEKNMRAMLSIDSEGGSIDDVIDIMAFCGYFGIPFDTYAKGKVYSAAFLLFCCGERRLATKNAEFWYHRPSQYVHKQEDDWEGIGRYLEFRESAITNEVMRRALAYQNGLDNENSMLSIPFLMNAGVVTETV